MQLLHIACVDVFFCIGGIVMTYNFLRSHAHNLGSSFRPLRHYLHRYVRLTPALAVLVWVQVTVYRWAYAMDGTPGPLWHEDEKGDGLLHPLVGYCKSNWWSVLTYIQNFIYPSNMCLSHTWYIMHDMQLTIVSPIILMLLVSQASMKTKIISVSTLIGIVSFRSLQIFYRFGFSIFYMEK